MSTKGKRLIFVGPAGESPLLVEGVATEAGILPGTVLDYADGAAGLKASDAASEVFGVDFMVADKNSMQSKSIDEAWTLGDNMVGVRPKSGQLLNVMVRSGNTLAIGTPLARHGVGALRPADADGSHDILCYSEEAVTTTTDQLVTVRVA